jgi:hypothetical protein
LRQLSFLVLGCLLLLAGGCYRSHAAKVARPPIIAAAVSGSQPLAIPDDQRHVPHQITVHHSWDPAFTRDTRPHFLITRDGRILEGAPVELALPANPVYDTRGHIAVQLSGDFDRETVTLEQLQSAVHLIAWLCDRHVIPPSTISGHRDVAAGTDCPGRDLQRYVDGGQLRVWVAETIAGRQPRIQLMSDDPENSAAQRADSTDP